MRLTCAFQLRQKRRRPQEVRFLQPSNQNVHYFERTHIMATSIISIGINSGKVRCRPGHRAIFIHGVNVGRLVVVERRFVAGEEVDGQTWKHNNKPAWVVRSLCGHLKSTDSETGEMFCDSFYRVADDDILQPLPEMGDDCTAFAGDVNLSVGG
jgi:hypothetical protein